jgi:hypothetical protein
MPTRYDIFLSYSRANTALVTPLRDELRRRGYRVFFDTQSLAAGKPWKPRLKEAIQHSRVMVLCWSETAARSEVTAYEYTAAEALNKTVIPWLLDATDLPIMIKENQGSKIPDPAEFVTYIRPTLGGPLAVRRRLQSLVAVLLLIAVSIVLWRVLHPPPPPPWEFQGSVTDRIMSTAIPGVEVDLTTDTGEKQSTLTDAQGHYDLHLPQPQPKTVQVLFRKDGYQAEHPLKVPTGKPFDMDMARIGPAPRP